MPRTMALPEQVKQNLKVAAVTTVVSEITKLYGESRKYWQTHFAYTVTIVEGDRLYDSVRDWLVASTPQDRHRAVTVSTAPTRSNSYLDDDDEKPEAVPLSIRFNSETTRKVSIEGHAVSVSVSSVDNTASNNRDRRQQIQFEVRTYLAQQAVLRLLEHLNVTKASVRKATLKMPNQWGNWDTRSDIPARTMDSVSLPAEQKARIIADFEDFLGSEETYNRLALPWHRGYMLYGPPGTGKTSLVKALANEFNLDLWYISLSDLKAESSLLDMIARVTPKSILLLEDIDTVKITHDRDSSEQGTISTSSLLNMLDGVATPHGLITVMTTNRFEILDSALTRAGRMDLIEKLDYPSARVLADMYAHFFAGAEPLGWESDTPLEGVSTSGVAELFKRNLHDGQAARNALNAYLDTALPTG